MMTLVIRPMAMLACLLFLAKPALSQDTELDMVALEKAVAGLAEAVEPFDKDAARFLQRKLKPLLISPAADTAITGKFIARLAQM